MTFKINGTALSRFPTNHRWINQDAIGATGDGHPMYPAYREYELEFDFATPSEFNEFVTFYNGIGITGTISADLPEYGTSSYTFRTYSGIVMSQPEYGNFFEQHYQSARLLLVRIRTA
jgi:hypothetical protein